MPIVQIADVIVPAQFTTYQVENSFVSTAFAQSGVAVPNGVMQDQLQAGAQQFQVPVWGDLTNPDGSDYEPNYSNDNPSQLSVPNKINAHQQVVRKSFMNNSWAATDFASELSGDNALDRIQSRVLAYWDRVQERRLIASLIGVLYSNVNNNAADMVLDISGNTGQVGSTTSPLFNATAVIQAAATLGDRMEDVKTIAMHSHVYTQAQINDEIQFIPNSLGQPIKTYRGMAVVIDDNLIVSAGTPANGSTAAVPAKYVSILFGTGAVGYAVAEPRVGLGTELFRIPSAGNGAGVTQLYSRMNHAISPLGFSWSDGIGANAIANDSPSLSDLANAQHWTRVAISRKSIPLAFLVSQ